MSTINSILGSLFGRSSAQPTVTPEVRTAYSQFSKEMSEYSRLIIENQNQINNDLDNVINGHLQKSRTQRALRKIEQENLSAPTTSINKVDKKFW